MASAAITVSRQPVSLADVPTHTTVLGDLPAALEHNRAGVRR